MYYIFVDGQFIPEPDKGTFKETSRSQLESDTESMASSISSKFSFLTQEKGIVVSCVILTADA